MVKNNVNPTMINFNFMISSSVASKMWNVYWCEVCNFCLATSIRCILKGLTKFVSINKIYIIFVEEENTKHTKIKFNILQFQAMYSLLRCKIYIDVQYANFHLATSMRFLMFA